ncbi:MAG: molybdopterin-dependent oxidoreductase, partial [Cyanobacteria bacterium P01_H01_bin.15]
MTLFRVPQDWELNEHLVTPERHYFNRRKFIKTLVGAGIGGGLLGLAGCQKSASQTELEKSLQGKSLRAAENTQFTVQRPITDEILAGQYNNFYEFGGTKKIWLKAQNLPLNDWQVEVTGLVKNPKTYDLDDLRKKFPLEERIYRFRCVEA